MSTRNERRLALKENARRPAVLEQIPKNEWPYLREGLAEVWRSRFFLVQVYQEASSIVRISVNRAALVYGDWADGISWEELMQVKREIGRGQLDAVEVYPADRDIVNVANMRHLWLLPEPLTFAWRAPA